MNENKEQPGMAGAARQGGATKLASFAPIHTFEGKHFVLAEDVQAFLRATKTEGGEAAIGWMLPNSSASLPPTVEWGAVNPWKPEAGAVPLYTHAASAAIPSVPSVAQGIELPPLPEPTIEGSVMHPDLKICYRAPVHFTAEQMEEHARAAVAAYSARQAQAAPTEISKRLRNEVVGGTHPDFKAIIRSAADEIDRLAAQAAPATPAPAAPTDLSKRLRERATGGYVAVRQDDADLMLEAADEIERAQAPAAPQAVQAPTEQTQQRHVMPPVAAPVSQHGSDCSACGGAGNVHRPDGEYMGECSHCEGMGIEPRKIVGYGDCRCILAKYCDGKCNPIWAEASGTPVPRVGGNTNDSRADLTAPSSTEARATAAEDSEHLSWLEEMHDVPGKSCSMLGYAIVEPSQKGWRIDRGFGGTEHATLREAIRAALRTTSPSQEPASGTVANQGEQQ
jgi:hypothetical protein